MSLLLQALQKAAKNRELNQRSESPGDVPPVLSNDLDIPASAFDLPRGPSLEIEPGDIEPPVATTRPVEREPRRIEAIPDPEPVPTPQQAAAVIGAATLGRDAKFNPVRWAVDHPVPALLSVIVPLAIGYGAYVFISVTDPGFFTRSKPTLAVGNGNAQRVAAASNSSVSQATNGSQTTTAPMPELGPPATPPTSVPSAPAAMPASAAPAAAAAGAVVAAVAVTDSKNANAAAPAATNKSVALPEPVEMAEEPVKPVKAPRSSASAGKVDRERARAATARIAQQPSKTPTLAPVEDKVQVTSTDGGATLTALLSEGYQALESGQASKAREAYSRALTMDPRNTDALLGLAATDWQNGDTERASANYYKVLEVDPQNADAQAGLIAMLGRVDPVSSETRLKQLIAREPSAPLYFALGNLYSQQGQWPAAQQNYFQALQLDGVHPDYNYNLAVSLEHIGQRKIALDYYRKALDLAKMRGHAGFDRNLANSRVSQLSQSQ